MRAVKQAGILCNLFACLAIVAVTVIATRPIWATSRWVLAGDALAHLYRTFALDRALRQGIIYPRWLPDLAFGYGYPNLNFYPPLTAYISETLHLLGWWYADAIKIEFVLAFFVAAWGAFVFGAELYSGEETAGAVGLVTAGVYVFAPYFIYDVYVRGGLAEIVAMAALPWLLWSLRRIVRQQTMAALAFAALFFAVIVLAHTLTLALALPLVGAYVIYELRHLGAAKRLRAVSTVTGATVLGAGLGAFYWLPYIAELALVKAGNNAEAAWQTFSAHFIALGDLVPPSPFHPYEGPVWLGLVTSALGILALTITLYARKKIAQPGIVFLFGAAAILGAFGMAEPSRPLWERVPAAAMIGFPWRLHLLVNLGLAVVIGSLPMSLPMAVDRWISGRSLPHSRLGVSRTIVAFLIVGLVAITSTARLAPRELSIPSEDVTLGRLARFEADSGFVGLTIWDEFFPTTVKLPIGFSDPVSIANLKRVPAEIRLISFAPTRRTFAVSAPEPTPIVLRTMWYTDWQATIDGAQATAYASTPLGLLTVNVPAGDHLVLVYQGVTPPRQVGVALSASSLLLIIGLGGLGLRRREPGTVSALATWVGILPIVLLPTALGLMASPSSPDSVYAEVGPSLRIIGMRVDGDSGHSNTRNIELPSTALHLTVYWHVLGTVQDDLFRWRLVDETGGVVYSGEHASRYGTGFPSTWVPNEIVEDAFDLQLGSPLAPQLYRLEVAYGQLKAYAPVDTLDYRRAAPSPTANIANEQQAEHPVQARIGEDIRLVGYAGPTAARAGDRVSLTTYWQSDRMPRKDYTTFVQLWDAVGNRKAQHDSVPGAEVTTMLWHPGKTVPVHHYLDLPAVLKPGLYTLVGGMYALPDLARLPVVTSDGPADDSIAILGQIKVPMPPPSAPPNHVRDISLGTSLRLLGYDLAVQDTTGKLVSMASQDPLPRLRARSDQRVRLELYWQAQTRMETDFKVFVHLVDDQGTVVAQQDRMPGDNLYPTHIWDAGETVIDSHLLPELADGKYRILAGLYSPDTGERLAASNSSGAFLPDRAIEIGTVEVSPP